VEGSTGPVYPPADAFGSIDSVLAIPAKSSPFLMRFKICSALTGESTTMTCRLTMPAEVSCEGNAREAGKTRTIASKPESQNTIILKFDTAKVIGRPDGCLCYVVSGSGEF